MQEIRECPLCGGKCEFDTRYFYGEPIAYACYCTKCDLSQQRYYKSKSYAIKKWNSRYNEKPSVKN